MGLFLAFDLSFSWAIWECVGVEWVWEGCGQDALRGGEDVVHQATRRYVSGHDVETHTVDSRQSTGGRDECEKD